MDEQIKEIHSFLQMRERPDIQIVALSHLLALTANTEGLQILCNSRDLLGTVTSLLNSTSVAISKDASLILVNVSAHGKGCEVLFKNISETFRLLWKHIVDPDSEIADPCCMILSNLTRAREHAEIVANERIPMLTDVLDDLLNVLTKIKYNNKGQKLYYLGPLLSNLSQTNFVRKYILHEDTNVIKKLLPFTAYRESVVKRGGIVGTLRNCCFETDAHGRLLSEQIDILPHLLLPLAGNTEYDEEDNDKLPPDLQYLPEDKRIEEDPDIRCMLLEALMQLCTLQSSREYIRSKNAYVILRELHKQESDGKALSVCEDLVNILIRTEDEIGRDNLKTLEVPDDLRSAFLKSDQESFT